MLYTFKLWLVCTVMLMYLPVAVLPVSSNFKVILNDDGLLSVSSISTDPLLSSTL